MLCLITRRRKRQQRKTDAKTKTKDVPRNAAKLLFAGLCTNICCEQEKKYLQRREAARVASNTATYLRQVPAETSNGNYETVRAHNCKHL